MRNCVSVLFSEPKIPQPAPLPPVRSTRRCFSALQRAENSSTEQRVNVDHHADLFQCSSASRKFLNARSSQIAAAQCRRFQCSSASRKFLNSTVSRWSTAIRWRFSALQRAENSSTEYTANFTTTSVIGFSALQRAENSSTRTVTLGDTLSDGFSALQRAENSSTVHAMPSYVSLSAFQCSSASRKFLNSMVRYR